MTSSTMVCINYQHKTHLLCFFHAEWVPYGTTVKMSTGKIPLYIMIAHSDDDEREIFKTFAEAGPMAEKVPDADTLENTFDAIIHADNLDGDYWLQEYLIIVDRPEWKTDDGVLVINKDFKGSIDGKSQSHWRMFAI